MKKSEIKTRIEEIKKQLKYIEERNEVCCAFGCKGEEEELLAELEELEELENMEGIVMKNLDYKNECIFYLGMEIMKTLSLDDLSMDIDTYYDIIKEIYRDYKKYDNNKKSLLTSIYDYINENKQEIWKQASKAFN